VPREGELEITININLSVDGILTAQAVGGSDSKVKIEEEDKVKPMIPDFGSGVKLNFGKK